MKFKQALFNLAHWGPEKNGRHFPDDIFKLVFLNAKCGILMKISLQYVPRGQIKNIAALVQIMAWRRPGASYHLNQRWLAYRRIYASLGLNEIFRCRVPLKFHTKYLIHTLKDVDFIHRWQFKGSLISELINVFETHPWTHKPENMPHSLISYFSPSTVLSNLTLWRHHSWHVEPCKREVPILWSIFVDCSCYLTHWRKDGIH